MAPRPTRRPSTPPIVFTRRRAMGLGAGAVAVALGGSQCAPAEKPPVMPPSEPSVVAPPAVDAERPLIVPPAPTATYDNPPPVIPPDPNSVIRPAPNPIDASVRDAKADAAKSRAPPPPHKTAPQPPQVRKTAPPVNPMDEAPQPYYADDPEKTDPARIR